MKIKIFSAYYGITEKVIENNLIKPIQGGALLVDNKLIDLKDSIYPEISLKNDIYNEFSVLYVIWKKYSKDLDYIGLCHYRRYFVLKKYKYIYELMKKIFKVNLYHNYFINKSSENFNRILNGEDGIIPRKKKLNMPMKDYYAKKHIKEHYKIFELIIKNNFNFLESVLRHSSNAKEGYFLNMFILKKELFEEYCSNLFSFLDILEKNIEIPMEDNYQKRVLGFLGERFTNLYFIYLKENGKKLKEYPIIWIENMNGVAEIERNTNSDRS